MHHHAHRPWQHLPHLLGLIGTKRHLKEGNKSKRITGMRLLIYWCVNVILLVPLKRISGGGSKEQLFLINGLCGRRVSLKSKMILFNDKLWKLFSTLFLVLYSKALNWATRYKLKTHIQEKELNMRKRQIKHPLSHLCLPCAAYGMSSGMLC